MPAESDDRPNLPAIIIVMGVSGSGKTEIGRRLAAELGFVFLDADDYHPPENVARMQSGLPLDERQRRPWLDRLAGLIEAALVRWPTGPGLVVACSALRRCHRDRIGAGRPGVRLVFLDGPEPLLRKRIEQRSGHFMPASLLASQRALLERPEADEAAITVDIAVTAAEIVRQIRAALAAS